MEKKHGRNKSEGISNVFIPNRYFSKASKFNINVDIYKDRESVFPYIPNVPRIEHKKFTPIMQTEMTQKQYENFVSYWIRNYGLEEDLFPKKKKENSIINELTTLPNEISSLTKEEVRNKISIEKYKRKKAYQQLRAKKIFEASKKYLDEIKPTNDLVQEILDINSENVPQTDLAEDGPKLRRIIKKLDLNIFSESHGNKEKEYLETLPREYLQKFKQSRSPRRHQQSATINESSRHRILINDTSIDYLPDDHSISYISQANVNKSNLIAKKDYLDPFDYLSSKTINVDSTRDKSTIRSRSVLPSNKTLNNSNLTSHRLIIPNEENVSSRVPRLKLKDNEKNHILNLDLSMKAGELRNDLEYLKFDTARNINLIDRCKSLIEKDNSKIDLSFRENIQGISVEEENEHKEEIREEVRKHKFNNLAQNAIYSSNLKSKKQKELENILFFKHIMKAEKKAAEKMAARASKMNQQAVVRLPGRKVFENPGIKYVNM